MPPELLCQVVIANSKSSVKKVVMCFAKRVFLVFFGGCVFVLCDVGFLCGVLVCS